MLLTQNQTFSKGGNLKLKPNVTGGGFTKTRAAVDALQLPNFVRFPQWMGSHLTKRLTIQKLT